MTKNSPRIYIYKITFEEVRYYYYGVHKEKKFGEYYMGSPITHKWVWDFYTPKKQILEFFEFNDKGYLEAQEVEKRLIKPFYNTDKWCLNKNCGGSFSLNICRKFGKMNGQKAKENKTGICGLLPEQRIENGKKGGKISGQRHKENKTGVCGRTKNEMIENGKKWGPINGKIGGQKTYELGVGIFGLSQEEKDKRNSKGGKIAGIRNKENKTGICGMSLEDRQQNGKKLVELGIGIFALTTEQLSENGKRGGKIGGKNGSKNTNSQIWECTITGHRSNPGALSRYQKSRNIDTTNRIRIS